MVRKRLRCGDSPCYVRDALRGAGTPRRGARLRVAAVGSAVLAMAVLLAACGGSSSDSNQKAGTYEVKVTSASFPPKQFVGQTSLLKIDARNTGENTVPDLAVTIDIEGKYGEDARTCAPTPRARARRPKPPAPPAPSTTPSPASPTETARSGSSPRPTPASRA